MKNAAFTFILPFLVLSACRKDKVEDPTVSASAAPFITPWTGGGMWTAADSAGFRTFRFSQPIEALDGATALRGTVMVFTRDLPQGTAFGVPAPDPVLGMPFDAFPDAARRYRQAWSYTHRSGSVEVQYTTNEEPVIASDAVPDSRIRFRYFVLPEAYLQARGLTPEAARRLNYNALCSLCGVEG